ncbi:aldehyde dehydrogenase family protein [Hellea balneolensis]|uniref:aldehyde dehydrogenase family protein n=1 Tax=Hellea balneolensis TaxID=287478 RepID=UPI000411B093|nr:aldehyde dehydrogenase family protein [Hellea balneolensis]
MAIQTQNPATEEIIKTFEPHSDAQVDLAIAKSVVAHQELRNWPIEERAKHMRAAAKILRDEAEGLAKIITLEMGKTYLAAIAEVKKCAVGAEYYADKASEHLSDEIVKTEAKKSYRKYLPLGPVLAVMPWNYPIWQVIRFAAPALMAGNTGLLKHASNVPQCALYIEDIFKRAGFPDGAFQTLLVGGAKVERILRDERVRAATLTGSEPAGASVASICGEEIKPTVLELGGSDAFIIMPSADIEKAVETGTTARTQNNGQSCIAAKRFFVHTDIYEDVKARMKASFEALKVGDPMKKDTDIGPLVNKGSYEEISAQVDNALKDGAIRVTGAEKRGGKGFFFTPGILENISKDSKAYHEEIFGPVALLFKVQNLDEAITIANSSPFGLSSAIFTNEADEQEKAINELEAGGTFVNAMSGSNPHLPFGGIKRSGYGRELAAEGIRAFCNIKTVYIA